MSTLAGVSASAPPLVTSGMAVAMPPVPVVTPRPAPVRLNQVSSVKLVTPSDGAAPNVTYWLVPLSWRALTDATRGEIPDWPVLIRGPFVADGRGATEGANEGCVLGAADGSRLGCEDGSAVGSGVGAGVGSTVGSGVGAAVGSGRGRRCRIGARRRRWLGSRRRGGARIGARVAGQDGHDDDERGHQEQRLDDGEQAQDGAAATGGRTQHRASSLG